MENNNRNVSNIGIFCSFLAIAFIVLRLADIIDWSWWWVLAPIWVTGLIKIGAIVVLFVKFAMIGRK